MKALPHKDAVLFGLIAFVAGAAAGAIGWSEQAAILFCVYFAAAAVLIGRCADQRVRRGLILLAPWLIVVGTVVIKNRLAHVYPLLVIPPLGVAVAFAFSRVTSAWQPAYRHGSAVTLVLILSAVSMVGMGNWVEYAFAGRRAVVPAPDFSFQTDSGEVISSSNLRGRVIVLDFWTTSCAVCYVKFPDLQKLHERYRGRKDVAIYSVHLRNRPETSDYPQKFFARSSFTFGRLWTEDSERVARLFRVSAVPTVVVIDRSGFVVFHGAFPMRRFVLDRVSRSVDRVVRGQA